MEPFMKVRYTASATVTGEGRNGHGRTSDGQLDLDLATPKEMGGPGGATNPEQLFAVGYAACFHSALKVVGRREKVDVDGSTVDAEVGIGPNDQGGFALQVALTANLPHVDQEAADRIVAAAHKVCPYSNATRGNIDVTVRAIGA
jgi:Ohr subfamily peroxiredoxin